MKGKLNMGMVGGGKDAFMGTLHRLAANHDRYIQLVCGGFSNLIRNLMAGDFYTCKTGIAANGYKGNTQNQ